jgi:hypothetical protein
VIAKDKKGNHTIIMKNVRQNIPDEEICNMFRLLNSPIVNIKYENSTPDQESKTRNLILTMEKDHFQIIKNKFHQKVLWGNIISIEEYCSPNDQNIEKSGGRGSKPEPNVSSGPQITNPHTDLKEKSVVKSNEIKKKNRPKR